MTLRVKEAHALSARHAAAHVTGDVTEKGGERSPPVAAAPDCGGRNASSCEAEGWTRMSETRRSRGGRMGVCVCSIVLCAMGT